MSSLGTDEPIIDAVITASDELFPGYNTGSGSAGGSKSNLKKSQKCGCSHDHCHHTEKTACCGGSCGCSHQHHSETDIHPIAGVEPIPLGKTRLEIPLTDEEIKKIAEITARDLENDDDEPTDEEIALLQQMFGVK